MEKSVEREGEGVRFFFLNIEDNVWAQRVQNFPTFVKTRVDQINPSQHNIEKRTIVVHSKLRSNL